MSKKRGTLAIIVRKTPKGLQPVSSFDAELLINAPMGSEFRVTKMSKRSLPQHRTYWKALTEVVNATDKWPTAEHLHDALKRACGYITVTYGLDGKPFVTTDSTAFDAMDGDAFKAYMDRAMEKLADAIGFDPLAFLEAA